MLNGHCIAAQVVGAIALASRAHSSVPNGDGTHQGFASDVGRGQAVAAVHDAGKPGHPCTPTLAPCSDKHVRVHLIVRRVCRQWLPVTSPDGSAKQVGTNLLMHTQLVLGKHHKDW